MIDIELYKRSSNNSTYVLLSNFDTGSAVPCCFHSVQAVPLFSLGQPETLSCRYQFPTQLIIHSSTSTFSSDLDPYVGAFQNCALVALALKLTSESKMRLRSVDVLYNNNGAFHWKPRG